MVERKVMAQLLLNNILLSLQIERCTYCAVWPALGVTKVQTFPLLLNHTSTRWREGSLFYRVLTFWIMVCRLVECSADERVISSHYRGTSPWITSNYFLTSLWNNSNTKQSLRYYIKLRHRTIFQKRELSSSCCRLLRACFVLYNTW